MSRTTRKWIIVAVVVIVALGVVALAVTLLGGVTVPDVVGKTQVDATRALEDAGLKVGQITSANDSQAAAGTVLLQDPAAGSTVDDGASVGLTVSSGPGTAAVPDVVGMTRADAQAALADAGFVPASVMQYDLQAPWGRSWTSCPRPASRPRPARRSA